MSTGNELPDLLRRLHAELERASTLDDESRRLLGVLSQDLQKFESHMSSARGFAVRFEAEHPEVAATLRQIADIFGKAGI
jgi:Domain of unknown function (DUF4404)